MSRRVALVTGASRGIGRAIAVELSSSYLVAVNFKDGAEEAKETLSLIEQAGGEGMCVQADVRDSTDVDRCFTRVEEQLGPVEILVNNAGTRRDGLAISLDDDAWDEVIATNLFGTFACCRRALRSMLGTRFGRIVNIVSVAGLKGSPGQSAYAASKSGVIGLTKTLAREVGAKGITVNAVAPGLVMTDLTTDLPPARLEKLLAEVPQKRSGEPQEIARAVAFLCSKDSGYINGNVTVVDGGMVA